MGTLAEFKNEEIGDLLLRVGYSSISKLILKLFLQVQDELKHLKNMVSQDGSKIDIKSLQTSLAKAEHEIKVNFFFKRVCLFIFFLKQKSDYYINQLNSQVKIIPSSKNKDEALPATNFGATIESIWDISNKNRKTESAIRRQLESRSLSNMNSK